MASSFPALGEIGVGATLLRVEGTRTPLDEKIAGLRALMPHNPPVEVDGDALFRDIGNGHVFVDKEVDVWRMMLPPQAARRCAEAVGSGVWLADWAGGLLWIGTIPDDDTAANRIRAVASSHGGHATLLRASAATRGRVPVFQPEPESLAALSRSVKAAFDPLGIFNPGRMFEGV
jgi:glycolate oxidase FAD binding subunit